MRWIAVQVLKVWMQKNLSTHAFLQKKNYHKCRVIKNKKVFLDKIKTYATELGDTDLLRRIQEELNSDDSTCLCYHNNCSLNYFAEYQNKIHRPLNKDWASKRDYHRIARERLIGYIEREIIQNQLVLSMAHPNNCFFPIFYPNCTQLQILTPTYSALLLFNRLHTKPTGKIKFQWSRSLKNYLFCLRKQILSQLRTKKLKIYYFNKKLKISLRSIESTH